MHFHSQKHEHKNWENIVVVSNFSTQIIHFPENNETFWEKFQLNFSNIPSKFIFQIHECFDKKESHEGERKLENSTIRIVSKNHFKFLISSQKVSSISNFGNISKTNPKFKFKFKTFWMTFYLMLKYFVRHLFES